MMVIFWVSLAVIAYTYVLYPAIVFLSGLLFKQSYVRGNELYKISIVIAARNEAKTIGKKLENLMELNYPRDSLEIIIASDGSTDQTEEIVRRYAKSGIELLALPRLGKADALNTAIKRASGDILVFSDANSMFDREALKALAEPFADPKIGGVAGNQCYLDNNDNIIKVNGGEKSYWNFDRVLKQSQSKMGNTISATGAIYAIRRSLFQPIPAGVTDDFVTSTQVIAQGYRLVFAPNAVAYEPAAESDTVEFGRKVRIMTRGLQGVLVMRKLLNPFRYGFYSVELFSHKVLRRLVVFPLITMALASPFLWKRGLFYQLATIGQAVFYALGLGGFLLRKTKVGRSKLLALPYYFCMVYTASLLATINIARGRRIDRWEPQREEGARKVRI